MTRNLKEDLFNRLNNLNNSKLFCTYSGKQYSIEDIEYYFFNILKKVNSKSNKVVFYCDASLESHIISIFLILSKYDVYLLSSFSSEINDLDLCNSTIITLNRNIFNKLNNQSSQRKLIFVYSLEEFLKWSHPSFNKKKLSDDYYKNFNIGKSVFLSSGSTGKPKLIPLNYREINACYNNVFNGFLKDFSFRNIISIHDTSFVIILPFIFCLAANENSILHACDINFLSNPILNLSTKIKYFDDFILISVPSVFRLLIKLLKGSANDIFKESNLITCGEPLDKELALNIFKTKPKNFFNLYGSTEVAPWILFLDIIEYIEKLKNFENIPPILPAGLPLPNIDLELSETSELLVKSESIFEGYENLQNQNTFKYLGSYKFFRTGDYFVYDEKFFFCKGRINSSVKIAGVFINPILLEFELKDKLFLENILLIPDIVGTKLIIILFGEVKSILTKSLFQEIKETINSKSSKAIPIEIKIEDNQINYLRSGKINRSFYKEKYLIKN